MLIVGVTVGVTVGVGVFVGVTVCVGVLVGVGDGECDRPTVLDGVGVIVFVGVTVELRVTDGVNVGDGSVAYHPVAPKGGVPNHADAPKLAVHWYVHSPFPYPPSAGP